VQKHGDVFSCMEHGNVFFWYALTLYILDVCPENWDESKGNSIIKLWLQFIPIFGALHSQLRKGHTKKDISMFLICITSPQKGITKKDISMRRKRFLSPITLKRSAGVI
jgi:hypothetical protein